MDERQAGPDGRAPGTGQGEAGPPEELGGDPVCWLPRVCAECGGLADGEPPTVCPRCQAPIGTG